MIKSKEKKQKKTVRRYGATVFAKVQSEVAGMAIKILEHAPDIQVVGFEPHKKEKGMHKLTLRSLEFPRFWNNTEVDFYGNMNDGRMVLYHPAGLDKDNLFSPNEQVLEEEEEEEEWPDNPDYC